MKKEEWFCNLCGEKRDKQDLYAFWFNGQVYVLLKWSAPNWPNSDKHICKDCVLSIKEAE